jgi:hypothetical protein
MARNWLESRAGQSPATDALRGAVKLPPDFDERAALTEELQKKQERGQPMAWFVPQMNHTDHAMGDPFLAKFGTAGEH